MSLGRWNDRYAARDLPWDTGEPDPQLVRFVQDGRVGPGRTLEVGSGTGTNAIWLAERGFDVLGVDVSAIAVEEARVKAAGRSHLRFEVVDFLAAAPASSDQRFVFDRGCWHSFDEPADRARFAAQVAAVLAPDGVWFSLIGSTEGGPHDMGPPRRSARDIAEALEPVLEIVDLDGFDWRFPFGVVRGWACVSRPRTVTAVPSTRRD
jgi:SAM-dependent methyltransferase